MPNKVIYNGNVSDITYTDWFIECDYFFLEVFGIGDSELEIDAYLNVEIDRAVYRIVPIIKASDSVAVNLIDTENLFTVPTQFKDSKLRKRLVLLGGNGESLKITTAFNETACDRTEKLSQEIKLLNQANLLVNAYNSQLNLQQNAALGAFAVGIGAAVPTAGASLVALPAAVLPLLIPIPIPAAAGLLL